MKNMRNNLLYIVLSLTCCILFVSADPCRRNYGGCHRSNGLCWGTGTNTHFCSCKAGYRQDTKQSAHRCVDIDECAESNVCGDNAICENTDGNYKCDCLCGFVMDYTGTRCLDASQIEGMCVIPRSCKHDWWWWFGGVPFRTAYGRFGFIADTSAGTQQISRPPPRTCSCESGYQLDPCGYCEDVNECTSGDNECRGSNIDCINTEGSYYCECRAGFILGPCRRRCYRERGTIPTFCNAPDLSSLDTSENIGSSARSYVDPILLSNYRTCAPGKSPGDTTIEQYDLNGDRRNDVRLTWDCTTRGASILKGYAEEPATWSPWTCWSKCKATCWGGLQTRTRRCRNGLPGVAGCEREGSQKRSCYSGPKCQFRIRKDASTLSNAERSDLYQAMQKYRADTTVTGFHTAGSTHGWPFVCNKRSCCPHSAQMKFISWHRSIVLNYEEGLAKYLRSPTLGLPYWNWLHENPRDRAPPAFAWDKTVRIDGKTVPNPFGAGFEVLLDRTGAGRVIVRDDTSVDRPVTFAFETWRDITTKHMKPHSMHTFSESLESAHNGPHVSTCSGANSRTRCSLSLASLRFASFDPIFMMHHAQVDRLWAVSQKSMEDAGQTTWTKQTALEALEDEGDFGQKFMPFGNTTINNFRKVQSTNTMHDSYYYEELTGVKYDNVVNDGFPVVGVGSRALRPGGEELLFVAHYLQSVTRNVFVNYYLNFDNANCTDLTAQDLAGWTLLLGTDRVYRNRVPRLRVIDSLRNLRGLDQDHPIHTCYTFVENCQSNCPEATLPELNSMPDAGLVYYIRNQPVDVLKFRWQTGYKVPNWQINVATPFQWVFFFGNRAGNVVQVQTAEDWQACRLRRSKPFTCNLGNGACLLRPGIYYLVDNDVVNCRAGLRMQIAVRL